jgi:hypothetical protein
MLENEFIREFWCTSLPYVEKLHVLSSMTDFDHEDEWRGPLVKVVEWLLAPC